MSVGISFRFGCYELRPGTGLFRDGTHVPVPPKEFGLLRLLVRLGGKIASHQMIAGEIWPGEFVSYGSVTRSVYSLRRLLGGDHGVYIETVPKRGYRLALPVKLADHSGPAGQRAMHPDRTETTIRKSVDTVPLAHSHFLEGLREANRPSPEAQERAVALFEEAHRVDPSYAIPLSAIADVRMYQTLRGYLRPADGERLGREACQRALSLDPKLASARAALGWYEGAFHRDVDAGLTMLDEALADDEGYARAYIYRAWVLRTVDRLEESVDTLQTAVRLDPHSLVSLHALAWALFCAGRGDEALEIERTVRRDLPYLDIGHGYAAVFAAWLGLHEEAIAAAREGVRITANNPAFLTALSYALARAGQAREAKSIADSAQSATLPRAQRPHLAMTYVALGHAERAIELLREGRDERCPWFFAARADPRLDYLASDARLQDLYD